MIELFSKKAQTQELKAKVAQSSKVKVEREKEINISFRRVEFWLIRLSNVHLVVPDDWAMFFVRSKELGVRSQNLLHASHLPPYAAFLICH